MATVFNYLKSQAYIGRKEFIVRQIINIQLIITLFLDFIFIISYITARQFNYFSTIVSYFLVASTIFLIFAKFYLLHRVSYVKVLFILITFSYFMALALGIYVSPNLGMIQIQAIVYTLTLSILVSTKYALRYVVLINSTFILMSVYYESTDKTFSTSSFVAEELIISACIVIIWVISKLGYDEVKHSYQEAARKAQTLEKLNNELNDRVEAGKRKIEDQYRNQIETLHKMAILGTITRSIFHDIKTPLSSIEGAIRILERSDDNQNFEFINLIKESNDQIKRIMQDAQDLYKGKSLTIDTFKIKDIVDKVLVIVNNYLVTNTIKAEVKEHKDNIEISGIKSIFERILMNIIVNAIEELKESNKERNLLITIGESDEFYEIKIRDNGRGIDEENVSKIFDSDFSSKTTEHNMGLGLPYVKSTLQKEFNSKISVISTKGEFTEFIIHMPKQ